MAEQSDERVNRLKTTAILATDRVAEEPAGTHFGKISNHFQKPGGGGPRRRRVRELPDRLVEGVCFKERADGILVLAEPLTFGSRHHIADLAVR